MAVSPSSDTEFRKIFDAHFPAVQRYCARRLGPTDANDAVSEVFLVAWRRLEHVPGGEDALPWLLGVARNMVRNSLRSIRRSRRLSAKAAWAPEPVDTGPEVYVVRHSEYEQVDAALNSLGERDREIIRLRAWEELSAPQIAAVLGISTAAAEKRMTRALNRLSVAAAKPPLARPRVIEQGGDA